MRNASISADDLKSESSVVRNELEMDETDPEGVLDERIVSTAFLWHNYGRSTVGSRADIEHVATPALRAFYDNYYQPDNAVLIITGKFDEAKTLAIVAREFGKIPRPTRKILPTYTVDPEQRHSRTSPTRPDAAPGPLGMCA